MSGATTPARVVLRGGRVVWTRPLEPEDAESLRTAFAGLSAESRYQRFHSGTPVLSDAMLRSLTRLDHHDREALVAFPSPDAREVIAVARYARDPQRPEEAEMAITVADEWHGHGLATALLRDLSACAVARGIEHFTVDMLADNAPVLALVWAAGGKRTGTDGPVISARLALDISRASGTTTL